MPDLILASTSPYRRELLERLGVPFRCVSPGVDEDVVKQQVPDPTALALQLAIAKARAVANQYPNAVVIGSDQLATFDNHILGKPGLHERAIEQLEQLRGRTHELLTAVCITRLCDNRQLTHLDRTSLTMRPLNRFELERYVTLDKPTDCAGAYKIEASGIALFEKIETADFTAITGLPLIAVVTMCRDFGIAVP